MALRNSAKLLVPKSLTFFRLCRNITCGSQPPECKENKDAVLITIETEEDVHKRMLNECTLEFKGPGDITPISGIPAEHIYCRTARIFKPCKSAMQSGTGNIGHWEVIFDTRDRWENPLMGWCSSGDPQSNTRLRFSSKEEAIDFCDKNGWKWTISKCTTKKKFKVKSYAKNFVDKRCRVSTK